MYDYHYEYSAVAAVRNNGILFQPIPEKENCESSSKVAWGSHW